jgi:hypothetical protein
MPEKSWKRSERKVAQALQGRRIPVTGLDRGEADVKTPLFDVQVKRRRKFPDWLWGWTHEICATARRRQKIGLLVLGRPGQRHSESLVVMRMTDFVDLLGPLKYGAGEEIDQSSDRGNHQTETHAPETEAARVIRPAPGSGGARRLTQHDVPDDPSG